MSQKQNKKKRTGYTYIRKIAKKIIAFEKTISIWLQDIASTFGFRKEGIQNHDVYQTNDDWFILWLCFG